MNAWGRIISTAMNGFNSEADTGLVRMFRIEYAKDYRHMKQMGYEITDSLVRSFLSARKHS
jgi:hypothetical protein